MLYGIIYPSFAKGLKTESIFHTFETDRKKRREEIQKGNQMSGKEIEERTEEQRATSRPAHRPLDAWKKGVFSGGRVGKK